MDNETRSVLQQILEKVVELDSKVTKLDSKVVELDSKVTKLDSKVMELDSKVMELDSKVMELDSKVMELDGKVTNIEVELAEVKQLSVKTAIIQETTIADKIQLIYENQVLLINNEKKYKVHDGKIEMLENDVFALKYAFKNIKQG